jgi:GNAT superfamily N-acetyltransferase
MASDAGGPLASSRMTPLRPMRQDDSVAVHHLAARTFAELEQRLRESPSPEPPVEAALIRFHQLLVRDPGGAWVAERDGELIGAALAIDRDGLWGLSLLVVDPAHQSGGLGRALLARTLEYADGGRRGAVILASPDARALRAYARAGFTPHPSLRARGRPKPIEAPSGVREGGAGDLELTERVDLAVRGVGHGSDIEAFLRSGCRLLVADRGYAVIGRGSIRLLAALDDATAADLLRTALATAPADEEIAVEWITARQDWAIGPVLDAGLPLSNDGAVFVRGDVGPFRPYLPSGAYL